jgi:hypothetical protein
MFQDVLGALVQRQRLKIRYHGRRPRRGKRTRRLAAAADAAPQLLVPGRLVPRGRKGLRSFRAGADPRAGRCWTKDGRRPWASASAHGSFRPAPTAYFPARPSTRLSCCSRPEMARWVAEENCAPGAAGRIPRRTVQLAAESAVQQGARAGHGHDALRGGGRSAGAGLFAGGRRERGATNLGYLLARHPGIRAVFASVIPEFALFLLPSSRNSRCFCFRHPGIRAVFASVIPEFAQRISGISQLPRQTKAADGHRYPGIRAANIRDLPTSTPNKGCRRAPSSRNSAQPNIRDLPTPAPNIGMQTGTVIPEFGAANIRDLPTSTPNSNPGPCSGSCACLSASFRGALALGCRTGSASQNILFWSASIGLLSNRPLSPANHSALRLKGCPNRANGPGSSTVGMVVIPESGLFLFTSSRNSAQPNIRDLPTPTPNKGIRRAPSSRNSRSRISGTSQLPRQTVTRALAPARAPVSAPLSEGPSRSAVEQGRPHKTSCFGRPRLDSCPIDPFRQPITRRCDSRAARTGPTARGRRRLAWSSFRKAACFYLRHPGIRAANIRDLPTCKAGERHVLCSQLLRTLHVLL